MTRMDSELAELCRTIDPIELGNRIRAVRQATGMTQTQLAAGEISTGYVSRIESGQRRPEFDLLGRMAERMGTTARALLVGMGDDAIRELQFLVDQAELELASGDAQAALSGADKALGALQDTHAVELSRAARQVRAGAQEAIGDLDGAVETLEELASTPSPDAMWLRSLIALSRCLREEGDLDRAISVGEDAAPVIEEFGLSGTTEAIQLRITVAAGFILRGDTGHAMRRCKQAIEIAEKHGLPIATASGYWNASLIESRHGAFDAALDLARTAISLFEEGDDTRNLGRLRTQIAILQLRLDPPDAAGAIETLEQAARELDWSAASTMDRADHHLAMARARFLLGDHQGSMADIATARAAAGGQVPLLLAEGEVLQGQIAAASSDVAGARDHYQAGIRALTGMGADREAAQLWFELGGLLQELGEADAARDAFRSAAASRGLSSSRLHRTWRL